MTDPIGDSLSGASPDIASASIAVEVGTASFRTTFAPGTSLGDSNAVFVLDVDRDPATGFPGGTPPTTTTP